MNNDLIIIGAGGFGTEVAWLVNRINNIERTWNLLGFVDDNKSKTDLVLNYPVLGNLDYLYNYKQKINVICSIANPKIRNEIVNKISSNENLNLISLIDPSAIIGESCTIGEGSIICANTIITTNAKIGKNVIINLACTIGHSANIDNFVTIYPTVNISGNVIIGYYSEIGTGSQIIQDLEIGSNVIIGAGSVVVRTIKSNCTCVGCPAKPIKFNNKI